MTSDDDSHKLQYQKAIDTMPDLARAGNLSNQFEKKYAELEKLLTRTGLSLDTPITKLDMGNRVHLEIKILMIDCLEIGKNVNVLLEKIDKWPKGY